MRLSSASIASTNATDPVSRPPSTESPVTGDYRAQPRISTVLSAFDDFPVHQTPLPIAQVAGGHPDAFERYLFTGFETDGSLFFGCTVGIHPNREIMDASMSLLRDNVQRSLNASCRFTGIRHPIEVGPFELEIIEPLRVIRIAVGSPDLGITGEVVFTASTPAIEEPLYTRFHGAASDFSRLVQPGSWQGHLEVDGETIIVSDDRHRGTRERSWGIRPTDGPPRHAPSHELPQAFDFSAVLTFDDGTVIDFAVGEHGDGSRYHESVVIARPDGDVDHARNLRIEVEWEPSTRRCRLLTVEFETVGNSAHRVEMHPVVTFPLRGLGFTDPAWTHGSWKGELVVGTRSWKVDDLDPTDYRNVYVQQLTHATWTAPHGVTSSGTGILEQLAVNDHAPSGLVGFLDGAR